MTTQDKLVKRKLSLLELAEFLKNVSQACKINGRYCQMLCTALGSDPVYFNAVNKFYSFNYLC
jgi:hypothetical protein